MLDKVLDKILDNIDLSNLDQTIETNRFGPFTFCIGLDVTKIVLPLQRVADAQERFKTSPLSSISSELEKEIVVSSVYGTNTIEGGELSEEETQLALNLSPSAIKSEQQQRAINIKNAYEHAKNIASSADWNPSLKDILDLHSLIFESTNDTTKHPTQLRDNPKNNVTRVGSQSHGGVYKPPQYGKDVKNLLQALIDWNIALKQAQVPALIRAPLFHYYFELIHPFWDGNGRVGRVLEASILYAVGFTYAPFVQARYYLKNIDEYFALFNHCRKGKQNDPNTDFVNFFLEGMFDTINHLHDRVNFFTEIALFRVYLAELLNTKKINSRQHEIVHTIFHCGKRGLLTQKTLESEEWHKRIYSKLSDKTKDRDFKGLIEKELIWVNEEKQILPYFMKDA